MSIEKNIERIADALEALVTKLDHIGQAVDAPKPLTPPVEIVTEPVSTTATSVAATAPTPSAPPAPATPPPAAQEAPAPVATMTPEQLNQALVEQFQRLGTREPIDKVMREQFGAQSITDLKPEQYAQLITAVKAV